MHNSYVKSSLQTSNPIRPVETHRLPTCDRYDRPIPFRTEQPSRHHSPYIFIMQFISAITIVSKIPRILQWKEPRVQEEERAAIELRSPSPSKPDSNSPSVESVGTLRKADTLSALPLVPRSTLLPSSNISLLRSWNWLGMQRVITRRTG
uniref:Uncharacterized protein n=1 Tax=Cucumis melo TaxID=3656 RepID=A0A9I9CIX6_CUCME